MQLFMYSSILSVIVLCLVGLIKLPLVRFKGMKFYKAGLTLLTILLTIGAVFICQAYIICDSIISVGMIYLLFMTFGEVMLSYNGIYEGFGVKKLVNTLFTKIQELLSKSPESKLTRYADKLGLDNALKIINDYVTKKETENKEKESQEKIEIAKEV